MSAASEGLGRYFSPEVAQRIVEEGGTSTVPEARELSILLADIRDFTRLMALPR